MHCQTQKPFDDQSAILHQHSIWIITDIPYVWQQPHSHVHIVFVLNVKHCKTVDGKCCHVCHASIAFVLKINLEWYLGQAIMNGHDNGWLHLHDYIRVITVLDLISRFKPHPLQNMRLLFPHLKHNNCDIYYILENNQDKHITSKWHNYIFLEYIRW